MAVQTARVSKVTTGQYHQVLALTQYMINLGLENLFLEKYENKPLTIQTLGNGFRSLVLGPPKIIIETLDDNQTNIYYRIHLKSGNFQTAVDGPNGQVPERGELSKIRYEVNDWYFTFGVDLAQIVLKDDDPRKGDALKRLKRTMGKYTVQQLMVNMKTANIGNPSQAETSFGKWTSKDAHYTVNEDDDEVKISSSRIKPGTPRDWSAEPDSVKKAFNFIITLVIDKLVEADLQNLGITAAAIDAGRLSVTDPGHPPTFMPVDCRFQTYPWMDPNDPNYKEYNGNDGKGRLNYLLYLEMTGNSDGTTPEVKKEGRFLEHGGNWTDGTQPGKDAGSKFGTYMLTHQKFMNEYLLPKFDKINRMVTVNISDLKADVTTKGFWSGFSRGCSLKIGDDASPNSDEGDAKYRFTKTNPFGEPNSSFLESLVGVKGDPTAKVWSYPFETTLSRNAVTWYTCFKEEPIKVHKTDKYLDFLYKAEHWGEAQSVTGSRLSIEPGTNEILYEACSRSRLYWERDWDIVPNEKTELICEARWVGRMTMAEASDGGLVIKITNEPLKIDFSGHNKDVLSFYETYFKDSYERARANFGPIMESIKNALEGQERFFLPASGIFYFKNPIFNHEASLLCELEYKGNAEIEESPALNPDGDTRKEIGDTTVLPMLAGVSSLSESHEENKSKGEGGK